MGFFEATAGVEEGVTFIGNSDVASPSVVGANGIDDLIRKMVDVDDDVCDTGVTQFLHLPLQQRFACHGNQRFGHGVGKRFETRSETSAEDHRLHKMYDLQMYEVRFIYDLFQSTMDTPLTMDEVDGNGVFGMEMFGKLLGAIDGAMLTAGAPESDLEVGEVPFEESLHMMVNKSIDGDKESENLAVLLEEVDNGLIESG